MKRVFLRGGLVLAWLLLGYREMARGAEAPIQVSKTTSSSLIDSNSRLTAQMMSLVRANCASCHNEEKRKGGLSVASQGALLKGGDNGPVVNTLPGASDKSLLLQVLSADSDPHMPPKKQLTPRQIDDLRQWVLSGVPWNEAAWAEAGKPRAVTFEDMPVGYHPILALALNPAGTRLAVGRAKRIDIWDVSATNATVLLGVDAGPDVVRSLQWSLDGQRLASGSFREITVWNPNTLGKMWSLSTNEIGRVTAMRFTPFGGALLAADYDPVTGGWIRLFSADSGKRLSEWSAHTDTIYDLAISPDGGLLASAGGDKMVKLWELVAQREVARFEGHTGAVVGLAFNTNITELITVGADKQLKLWDVRTRESVVTIGGRKQGFNGVTWSSDGQTVVAVTEDGRVISFKDFKRHTGEQSSATATERELARWPEVIHAIAVTADAKRIYAGGDDGVVYGVTDEGKLLPKLEPAPVPTVPTLIAAVKPLSERLTKTGDTSAHSTVGGSEVATRVYAAESPSFVHDVLPLLAKAGCSAGSCHAKPEGQNGFKLSVFSYDPRSDYTEIVKEGRGRRVFPAAPDSSLLLLKPTLAVEHGGGQRIEVGSETHQTLLRWIRGGMIYQRTNEPSLVNLRVEPREGSYHKNEHQKLRVNATYSDGTTRDVTHLTEFVSNDKEIVKVDDSGSFTIGTVSGESVVVARFMGLVDASRVSVPYDSQLSLDRFTSLPRRGFIDELSYAQFQRLGLYPSESCSDAEFMRRSALDAIGRLPTRTEARVFLADTNSNKRSVWIDKLLIDPSYSDYWANKWADLLRPNPDRVGIKSVVVLDQWLRDAFRANTPFDQFAKQILLAEGSNHRNGPIVVYRDRREPSELTTMFSQLFLGVRMECAKCHHHPNEKWSQDNFYQFAAFFGPLKQKGAGLSPPISAGMESFYYASGGVVRHPVTHEVMLPRPPDGPAVLAIEGTDPRRELATWLSDPKNPFFARAAVNRVWAAFFGRGFVEPVDDFRVSNPPSNEPLLQALAEDFVMHQYDLKHLMKEILQSHLYQLGSQPNDFNRADTKNFSRSYRRRLPAEVLLDAVCDVSGVREEFNGCSTGTRAIQTWSYKVRSHFMDAFGRPNSSSDCPCERDTRTSVVQSLHMMNSQAIQAKLSHPEGFVKQLADSAILPEPLVVELYLTTLSRFPTAAELTSAVATFADSSLSRQTAAEDVLWALLNSAEFVFNH